MPTTFPWLFEGKEGKELARYTGVQRAYAGDKVIDESPDDGQRLGELIDLQGDMLRYEWINPSGEKEVVAAPSCEVRAAQSRPEKAKEDQPSSKGSRPGQKKGGLFGMLGTAGRQASSGKSEPVNGFEPEFRVCFDACDAQAEAHAKTRRKSSK